jgi:hypothetical protein
MIAPRGGMMGRTINIPFDMSSNEFGSKNEFSKKFLN